MWMPLDPFEYIEFSFHFPIVQWLFLGGLVCLLFSSFTRYMQPNRVCLMAKVFLRIFAFMAFTLMIQEMSGEKMWMFLLGSENDYYAEQAYLHLKSTVSVDWLVKEINTPNPLDVNVKFYLAHMLGCDLRELSPDAKAKVLAKISPEPTNTTFFELNDLNRDIRFNSGPLKTTKEIAEYYSSK